MTMMRRGRQTWEFTAPPGLLATAAIAGPREGTGPLALDFDYILPDMRFGADSFEKAEQQMQQKCCEILLAKSGLSQDAVDLFIGGDLINQNTPTSLTARWLGSPYWGVFSACATICQSLSLAALVAASGLSNHSIALASSHTCTAERQFRYPNEYGCQKPPHCQFTATACGAALVVPQDGMVQISAITIGKVCDLGIRDPFNMGAAMAPAYVDTVLAHLQELNRTPEDYDLLLSGDLGDVGRSIALDLFKRAGVELVNKRFLDCGRLLFGGNKDVFSGGSGPGCAASVGLGHIYRRLCRGELHRVLLGATGALLSPVSNQQKETIPGICHLVVLERRESHV